MYIIYYITFVLLLVTTAAATKRIGKTNCPYCREQCCLYLTFFVINLQPPPKAHKECGISSSS